MDRAQCLRNVFTKANGYDIGAFTGPLAVRG